MQKPIQHCKAIFLQLKTIKEDIFNFFIKFSNQQIADFNIALIVKYFIIDLFQYLSLQKWRLS